MEEITQLPCKHNSLYYEYSLVVSGFLASFYILSVFLRFVFVYVVCRFFNPLRNESGRWAIVTGGNSGIGRSYAFELAKNGMNLIIVARTEQTLRTTAEEIRKTYGVECRYIPVDLGNDIAFHRVAEEARGKDISVVINNAGIIGNVPCLFLSETDTNLLSMINLHVKAVVNLSQLMLSSMLSKKRGIVVTISSFSSIYPVPCFSHYSSCKAFSDRFTRAISFEYENEGLRIQSLIPNLVSTRVINYVRCKFLIPTGDAFVSDAVRTIGASRHTTGYWTHEIQRYVTEYLPISLSMYLMLKFARKTRNYFRMSVNVNVN
ncbi:inactive hydroxysteroid dehydrogenase-like protein 1 [Centruroides sculpturatus]|uniref:inactive hydroxysteroid dehydrogenase-like protein 1 n=1 Tax=Centruroides sculpturatus TaxID=218467 RepID=UPI000C6CE923|nr:inactive hydroxysteroid dehydrogenase-like protein 1 [Centruroides sculpturatus]